MVEYNCGYSSTSYRTEGGFPEPPAIRFFADNKVSSVEAVVSKEMAGIMAVMYSKYKKIWNGETWEDLKPAGVTYYKPDR